MLYTAMPLERIYHDMNKEEEETPILLHEFPTPYGRVYTEEIDGTYYIRGLESTNMADYLDEKYQIGAIYRTQ